MNQRTSWKTRLASTKLGRARVRGYDLVDREWFKYRRGDAPKVFVVGMNKTGTTTLAAVLKGMGYRLGRQSDAELLYHNHYFDGDFHPIVEYCRTAEAFQDVPFSAPQTFAVVDQAFPASKFVLSVRHSAEEWYESLVRFHGRLFGTDGQPPTWDQLLAAKYRTEGFMANAVRRYGTTKEDPYEPSLLMAQYESHNAAVRTYFADRPSQLLEVNVAESSALRRLEQFLGRTSGFSEMPHKNKRP